MAIRLPLGLKTDATKVDLHQMDHINTTAKTSMKQNLSIRRR